MPFETTMYPQATAGADQESNLFKQKFSETAYAALSAKMPELMQSVVSFKIIDANTTTGRGIGVFVIAHDGKSLYIPIILMKASLKPIEIMYYKDLNTFLPLDLTWLNEISKSSVNDMGQSAPLPNGTAPGVNLRDLTIPPSASGGRFGYASARPEKEHIYAITAMFKQAEQEDLALTKPNLFLHILANAPRVALDGIKLAFQNNPTYIQKLAANYGIKSLVTAMNLGYKKSIQFSKTAAARQPDSGLLSVLTKDASVDSIRQVFGDNTKSAYATILKQGYAVKDTRTNIEKIAMRIETPTFLTAPGPTPGWFRLYFLDGPPEVYYVTPNIVGKRSDRDGYYEDSHSSTNKSDYMVISPEGDKVFTIADVIGEQIVELTPAITKSKIYKIMTGKTKTADAVRNGSYGFFVCLNASQVPSVTPLCDLTKVVEDGGIKRISTNNLDIIIGADPTRMTPTVIKPSAFDRTLLLPTKAVYVEVMYSKDPENVWKNKRAYDESVRKNSIIKDPRLLTQWLGSMLSQSGAKQPEIKYAGASQWTVGKSAQTLSLAPALHKIATTYSISVADAHSLLKEAQLDGRASSFLLPSIAVGAIKGALDKFAAAPEERPTQYESTPGQTQGLPAPGYAPDNQPAGQEYAGGVDQNGQSIDPMGMPMQPQAPQIAPTDLAIAEMVQGLQQQQQMQQQQSEAQMLQLQQQLAMQQQSNEMLVSVLTNIQTRAQQIAQATNGMVPPEAMQSPIAAGQMLAPTPVEEPPPPPTPYMEGDNISSEQVAQNINPEMIDQAATFNDQGMFDTSAVASLASAPILQEIVATYIPNLEKAVDNLGRVLLTLWMKEEETVAAVGDAQYLSLEDKLRQAFKNMGAIVLSLNQNAVSDTDVTDRMLHTQATR